MEMNLTAEAQVISNFAYRHYSASKAFAKKVDEIEKNNLKNEFSDFFHDISIYCSSCIMSSVAALEAFINEIYLSPGIVNNSIEDFEQYFWGNNNDRKGVVWKPTLEKYKNALKLSGKRPLKRDETIYVNAEILIKFRNYLVHFKPIWSENQRDSTLENDIAGLFQTSPFLNSEADFLSMQCMSSGAANWSINTTKEFINEFGDRLDDFHNKIKPFR